LLKTFFVFVIVWSKQTFIFVLLFIWHIGATVEKIDNKNDDFGNFI